jgi:hypothetical protein
MSNRFAGSENLHVSGEITIAWETVRQRTKISVEVMLRYLNEMTLNHILWIFFLEFVGQLINYFDYSF